MKMCNMLQLVVVAVACNTIASALRIDPGRSVDENGALGRSTPRIIFMIRTGSLHYKDRVPLLFKYWGHKIPADDIFIAGDKDDAHVSAHDVLCPVENNHSGDGLGCATAHGLWRCGTQERFASADWVALLDDDEYIHVDNVHKVFESLTKEFKNQAVMLGGAYGCVVNNTQCKQVGLCGGAGVWLNQLALQKLVPFLEDAALRKEKKRDPLDSAFMERYRACKYDDIALGALADKLNISMQTIHGLFSWKLDQGELHKACADPSHLPLAHHYMRNTADMDEVVATCPKHDIKFYRDRSHVEAVSSDQLSISHMAKRYQDLLEDNRKDNLQSFGV